VGYASDQPLSPYLPSAADANPPLYQRNLLRRERSGRNGSARVAAQAEPPIVGS
jgi:hypothetical protein